MNPNHQKKGVFTSYANRPDLANPTKKENIVNDLSEQYHHRQQFQVIHNKNNLTVEQLQGARFAQSVGYSIERPEMHFKYINGSQQQTFVPPPPQRFLVSSGQSYSQPSTLPIHSGGHVQSVHAVQPLYQSIKRTYLPHHIINQIPIMDSQTKYYHANHEINQQEEIGIDGSDRKMLEQYQKLYDTYQMSQMKVQQLQRQLRQQREKKQSNGSEVKQIIITKEVLVEKSKKIDIKLLSSLIINKNKAIIDELVERKKNSCIKKLRALFSEEQSALKTTLLRASEQFTSTRVRTR